MNRSIKRQKKGFTLLEILLVIAAIGILASIVLVAINPNRQIEAARQAKRRSDINTITKAIQQYSIDNNGQYPAGIETGSKVICQTGNTPAGCIDLSSILVPDYLAAIPEADSNRYYVRKNISGTSIEVSHPKDNIWDIGGTPSLDLNFAKNKSLIDSVSGNNLITFTRNSTATYTGEDGLIKTAAINEPRFDHDPFTGESLGLLVEESRTNLLTGSGSLTTGWTRSTVNLGSADFENFTSGGPIGEFLRITGRPDRNSPEPYYVATGISVTSGTVYTVSFWCRRISGSLTFLPVVFNDGGTGVPLTNEWTRVSVQITAGYTGSTGLRIGRFYSTPPEVVFDIAGIQLETGSFPTSYIPTAGSTVTRQADNVSITGTNFSSWYNQSQGTAYTDITTKGISNSLPYQTYFSFYSSANDRWGVAHQNGVSGAYPSNSVLPYVGVNGEFSNILSGTFSVGQRVSIGMHQPNGINIQSSRDASIIQTTNTSRNPLVNNLLLGGAISDNSGLMGHIKRFTYWPTRLSNQTLQTITQ